MSTEEFNPYRAPEADLTPMEQDLAPDTLRPVPYEDIETEPRFWRRVLAMFTILFRDPKGLADRITVTRKLSSPWSFMVVLGIPGYLFAILMVALVVFMGAMADLGSTAKDSNGPPVWLWGLIPLLFLVLVPLMQFLGMVFAGLLNHGCLWIWGGLKQGKDLNATMRASGYFFAYFTLVSWVPLIGTVAMVLGPAGLGMALARIHRTDTWRGVCAAYTPLLACCCAYGLFILVMVAAASIGSALGT